MMRFELASLLNPAVLGGILLFCLVVLCALSIALIYHWREYGMNTVFIKMAPVAYLSVSGVLVAVAIMSYLLLI